MIISPILEARFTNTSKFPSSATVNIFANTIMAVVRGANSLIDLDGPLTGFSTSLQDKARRTINRLLHSCNPGCTLASWPKY